MKLSKTTRLCCILVLIAGFVVINDAISADTAAKPESGQELNEMPVLTGAGWQTMQPDSKIAFLWGMGHVVTVEEQVVQRHPELQRKDFVAKLAEGLRGVPMSTIIDRVDNYYRRYPQELDLPVVSVIWKELVRPKLKSGIADIPFVDED